MDSRTHARTTHTQLLCITYSVSSHCLSVFRRANCCNTLFTLAKNSSHNHLHVLFHLVFSTNKAQSIYRKSIGSFGDGKKNEKSARRTRRATHETPRRCRRRSPSKTAAVLSQSNAQGALRARTLAQRRLRGFSLCPRVVVSLLVALSSLDVRAADSVAASCFTVFLLAQCSCLVIGMRCAAVIDSGRKRIAANL